MEEYREQVFDEERALYGKTGVKLFACRFDGPADGESALKESLDIEAQDCFFLICKAHDQMSDHSGLIEDRHRIEPVCVCKSCVMRIDICSGDGISFIPVSAPLSEGIFIFYP